MRLMTDIDLPAYIPPIRYNGDIVSIGSCFSTVIGKKLQERKFPVLNNPFGTIFNPISIFELLQHAINQTPLPADMILTYQGRYLHFDCHSDVSATSETALLSRIKLIIEKTGKALSSASHLIITLGTAHVYEHLTLHKTVANCHKQPAKLFHKKLLSLPETKNSFREMYDMLKSINPDITIILTVSPVRHIKDGLVENQLSKSLLRVLCSELCHEFKEVNYFPSYEIMMDVLRDYRFYKEDLIHPSTQAENYIWEKFSTSFFTSDTLKKISQIDNILKSLKHKAFNPQGNAHQEFLRNLILKMEQMSSEIDFSDEINAVKKQLIS